MSSTDTNSADAPRTDTNSADAPLVDLLAGPSEPLGLASLASVLGGVRYVELEAFRRLGELSVEVGTDPAIAVHASGAALAHAWRGAQLEVLLPVSAGLPKAEDVTVSPGPEIDALLRRLGSHDPGATAQLSVVLAATYRRRLAHPHPSAEPSVARTLRRLLDDVESRARETASSGRGT